MLHLVGQALVAGRALCGPVAQAARVHQVHQLCVLRSAGCWVKVHCLQRQQLALEACQHLRVTSVLEGVPADSRFSVGRGASPAQWGAASELVPTAA